MGAQYVLRWRSDKGKYLSGPVVSPARQCGAMTKHAGKTDPVSHHAQVHEENLTVVNLKERRMYDAHEQLYENRNPQKT